ncbi:hypothetical protein [Lacihabitans lacunae]|uniref:Outer membrane protein beta-barrel domain-containing protein n=1 Tax=Lacihabitans lacunae TaxID=1028214 RepID=A0ABV7YTE4_9BACT
MMHNFNIKIILFYLLLIPIKTLAQDKVTWSSINKSYGLGISSVGIFGSLKIKLKNNFTFNSQFSHIGYNRPKRVDLEKNTYVSIFPKIKRTGLDFGISHKNWKKWLELECGFTFLAWNKNEIRIESTTGIITEGLQIQPKDFGPINLEINWSDIQPFFRVYLGKIKEIRKINTRGILGLTYMGHPSLHVNYTGFLETTNLKTDIKTIEKNMRNYSFYPQVGIELNFGSN